MSLHEFAALLQGIPGFSGKVAYYAFPESRAPELPYITYLETSSANMAADGITYFQQRNIDVELYTENKDPEVEAVIEAVLAEAGIPWESDDEYLNSERCYMRTYSITI